MNNALSLIGMDVAGFRRLKDPISLQFDAGPGVTLLVGPNGSGKSTVLDAIEWALTSDASRLPLMKATDAKRAPNVFKTLGSDADPSVMLYFASRDGAERHVVGHDVPGNNTSHFLRQSSVPWQDFERTATALRWTHFSSQRSVANLGFENGEAVLKAFAGPAGLERHKGLHGLLWGNETQAVYKTRLAEAKERLAAHHVALERVDAVLAGIAVGAESGPGQRLRDILVQLTRDIHPRYAAIGTDLSALESALATDRRVAEEGLAKFRGRTAERREAHLRVRRLEVEAEAVRQTVKTSVELQRQRAEDAKGASEALKAARARVSAIQNEIVSAREYLGKRERLMHLDVEMRRLVEEAREALAQFAAAERRRETLERFGALSARARAGRALVVLQRSRAEHESFGDAEAIREEAHRQLIALTARRDAITAERAAAELAITGEQDRLQSVVALAAALAGHLNAHDESCPVCAAVYPVGDLWERARLVTRASSPASELIGRQLKDLTHELGRISGQLQFVRARRDEAASVIAQLGRWRNEEQRQSKLFGEAWTPDAQEELETELLELSATLGVAEEPDLTTLMAATNDIVDRARGTSNTFNEQLIGLQNTYNELRLELQAAPEDAELHARLATLEPQLGRASARQAEAGDEFTFAAGLEAADAQAAQRAREVLSAMEKDLFTERRRLDRLDREYQDVIGTSDEVDHVLAVDARIALFGALLEQLRSIRNEFEVRRQSAQSDRNLDLVRASYPDGGTNASITALRDRVANRLAAGKLEVARIEAVGGRLKERARYRRQVELRLQGETLHPWNTLFRAVYTSLAGALGETLEWTMSNRATDLRFGDFDARPTPYVSGRPIHGWAAGHFFSEGQLAALQISSMITASILLPWSRWPALLLDDPLQHADVIKVGAFADLMRSLAQDRGHQIILTTHDATQANFIASKFRSAGLPAKILWFERQGGIRQQAG